MNMIITGRRRDKKYVVNTGTKMLYHASSKCFRNYQEFDNLKAAIRYFKGHPNRDQIDVRGVGGCYCLYFKEGRKIYENS